MKRKINILLLLLLPMFSLSCDKWLDVSSSTVVLEEDLFKSSAGYRQALNGIYVLMGKNTLYGKELTWGTSTAMSGIYDEDVLELLPSLEDYLAYTEDDIENEDLISGIYDPMWTAAYRVVANCNNLLAHVVDEDPELFEFGENERDIIEGEALGVRALMHFEMLRMFGYSLDEAGCDEARLPYVTDFYETAPTYYNTSDFLDLIIADLLASWDLQRSYDVGVNEYFTNGDDGYTDQFDTGYILDNYEDEDASFMSARGTRFNYYAVTMLLARAYLFKKDYDNAYYYANSIYGGTSSGVFGTTTFWATPSDDLLMSPYVKFKYEILFAAHQEDLVENYNIYDTDENSLAIGCAEEVFSDELTYDARYTGLISSDTKYSKRWVYDGTYADFAPVIRTSEAYHILAECMLREECSEYNPASAMAVMDVIRKARFGMPYVFYYDLYYALAGQEETLTNSQMLEIVWNDIKRESMDEGLYAWTEKRLGMGLSQPFPLPRKETDYNGL